ncbi:hypothetical protein ABZ700_25880 [Streptomyces diastaticus]|uniref:hypothetical protein n=1 Tax=Streptomyces diastaticus TaxID=1956 RepID=UPI0033C3658D
MISTVLLGAMAVCAVLLPVSVVAFHWLRERPDLICRCRQCARMRHPAGRALRPASGGIPRQGGPRE